MSIRPRDKHVIILYYQTTEKCPNPSSLRYVVFENDTNPSWKQFQPLQIEKYGEH